MGGIGGGLPPAAVDAARIRVRAAANGLVEVPDGDPSALGTTEVERLRSGGGPLGGGGTLSEPRLPPDPCRLPCKTENGGGLLGAGGRGENAAPARTLPGDRNRAETGVAGVVGTLASSLIPLSFSSVFESSPNKPPPPLLLAGDALGVETVKVAVNKSSSSSTSIAFPSAAQSLQNRTCDEKNATKVCIVI